MSTWDVGYTQTTTREVYQHVEADTLEDAIKASRLQGDWLHGEVFTSRTPPTAVKVKP
jgi:hypothetical protein